MKKIIYNEDRLEERDINKIVKRAKILIVNSKDEVLLAYSHKNYSLVGGHVEENESYDDCIIREVKEEIGIELENNEERKPYFVVEYLCKDYPEVGDNTNYIANYYVVYSDIVPDIANVQLTNHEKDGGFEVKYIPKNIVMDVLNKSLETCTKKNVVRDTIDAVEEFLSQN